MKRLVKQIAVVVLISVLFFGIAVGTLFLESQENEKQKAARVVKELCEAPNHPRACDK